MTKLRELVVKWRSEADERVGVMQAYKFGWDERRRLIRCANELEAVLTEPGGAGGGYGDETT